MDSEEPIVFAIDDHAPMREALSRLFRSIGMRLMNKQIAAKLGTSEFTVKIHRKGVMQKMKAGSLPELVRMAQKL